MKRWIGGAAVVAVLGLGVGMAFAFMGPGGGVRSGAIGTGMMGPGMMGAGMMGPGMMGPGMMRGGMMGAGGTGDGPGMAGPGVGRGPGGCPGMAGTGPAAEPITPEKARTLAQAYADAYLKGFTVDRVLPFTTGHGTAYSVELKGPDDEVRTLHVSPWGNVMPFGGPSRRGA